MTSNDKTIYLVNRKSDRPSNVETLPIGVLYVGAALKNAGYKVRVFHITGGQDDLLLQAVKDERPLFVGFSNFISPLLVHDIRLSRILHQQGVKVVWGGLFATSLPEVSLEAPYIDYIVTGEGEHSAVKLAEALANGEKPRGVPGAGYRDGGETVLNPPAPVVRDLDELSFGLDLIEPKDYISAHQDGIVYLSLPFSRGCPFRCAFCYNSMHDSRQMWRHHSAQYMKALLEPLKSRFGVNLISLVCDNAFGKIKKGQEIIESLDIKWDTSVHLSYLNDDFLGWAKGAGCHSMTFGIESGSDRILGLIGKYTTQEMIRERVRKASEAGFYTASALIFNFPGEAREETIETLKLMDWIYENFTNHFTHLNQFRAYPRTVFWDRCIEMGLEPPEDLEGWGSYDGRICHLQGMSKTKSQRLWVLANSIYLKQRSKRGLNYPVARTVLKKRLMGAKMNFPVEEALVRAGQAKRLLTGRDPGANPMKNFSV